MKNICIFVVLFFSTNGYAQKNETELPLWAKNFIGKKILLPKIIEACFKQFLTFPDSISVSDVDYANFSNDSALIVGNVSFRSVDGIRIRERPFKMILNRSDDYAKVRVVGFPDQTCGKN